MKNLYALDKNNSLIHIQSVNKELKEKFHCCNCGGELIARKGKVKAHHFSHKADGNCSYESYLHKVAKIKFYEQYSECLKLKVPFFIDYKTELTCSSCININIKCDLSDKITKFDLTKWFNEIYVEKGVHGFIADVLLKSSTKTDELLIEFAVTHKCEIDKIESGSKIVEVQLTNEMDLKFINDKHIRISDKNIELFNFIVNHKLDKFRNPKKCSRKFEFFTISKKNIAEKFEKSMSKIVFELETKEFKHYKILPKQEDEYTGQDFINLVKDYANKDKSFKNCYACRFVAKNTSRGAYYDLFCKRMRWEMPNSNVGSDCKKYWKFESLIG